MYFMAGVGRLRARWAFSLAVLLTLLTYAGCSNTGPTQDVNPPSTPPVTNGNGHAVTNPGPHVVPPENNLADPNGVPGSDMPKVVMTEAHALTCLVKPGQKVPNAELNDLSGQEQKLGDLSGDRGTVLLFWSTSAPYSVYWLEDLAADVHGKFPGVKVVAVSELDALPEAQKAAADAGADFPVLHDPQQEFFGKVATETLPRIYVLGKDREVLWLGMDYDEGTRRDFDAALKCLIKEETIAAKP